MGTLALFIGIDEFKDPNVGNLSGAKRDAIALWSLFLDSMSEIETTLLVDTTATFDAIRTALDDTLAAAGPEDTAIIFFAGHGSPDHRLLAYDTDVNDFEATTISMGEIAERFHRSRAKIVLCILDCCFSGGATARVFGGGAVPRGPLTSIKELTGKGRVLLAAANDDEPAYEHPATRHGLFTYALIEVLLAAEEAVSLPTALDQVLDRVRAEAGRLGVVQTPVVLGYVEGGLFLPRLRPGDNFNAAFPDRQGVMVGADIGELSAFGIPDPILAEWTAEFPMGLNALQLAAVNDCRVLDGRNLLVVAPTSAGKTFVGEMAAAKAVSEGRKSVFLLPYKALVNEKFDQFTDLYGDRLGLRVVRCTGDYQDQIAPFMRGKYDLALLTYEMFLSLALSSPSILNHLGLVVVDEAQFITDPHRGIAVELLLTLLVSARERGIDPQLIALSAVIGDINAFDQWLDCTALATTERPVKLVEGVLDRRGTYQFRDSDGIEKQMQMLSPLFVRVRRKDNKASAQDVIVPLVQQLVGQGEKVIVFRNQRGPAQGCANYLASDLGLPAAEDAIASLPMTDLSVSSVALRACLKGGTAFHTANLSREERVAVEQAFRAPESRLRVLAATTTVAAGINTPASTVILAEQEFVGEDGRPFTVAEYKNMAGRAGRLGFNEEGKSIILADTPAERMMLFRRYVMGTLEPIRSSFDPDKIETWMIRLLSQVERVEREQAATLLAHTYGGFLALKMHPDWGERMRVRLETLIQRMMALDLIEEEGDFVRLTLLGRACGRSHLSFEATMNLVEMLRAIAPETLTPERLMVLLQVMPQSEMGYTPVMKRGRAEAVRVQQAVERYGSELIRLLQKRVKDEYDYFGRCKRASILWDWISGTPMEEIEKLYSTTPYQGVVGPGNVRSIADLTRFHLRSAHEIASVMYVGQGLDEQGVDALLKRLEVGIPREAVPLLDFPIPFTRGEYLAFYESGVSTASGLLALSDSTVVSLVGERRAQEIAALRSENS
jgi:replicative superfamily II helicase